MDTVPDSLPDGSEYDTETATLTIPAEPDARKIAHAVVVGIKAVSDTAATGLDPLASAVDPAALNDIVANGSSERGQLSWISFPYVDHRVTVYSDGVVEIQPEQSDEP